MADKNDTGYQPIDKEATAFAATAKPETGFDINPDYNPSIYDENLIYDVNMVYDGIGWGVSPSSKPEKAETEYAISAKPTTGYSRP